jgi:uncharacterized membrane protein
MSISKWTIEEYEYSLVEFVISFVVVYVIAYFLLITIVPSLPFYEITALCVILSLIVGVAWTYSRAHGLFTSNKKGK